MRKRRRRGALTRNWSLLPRAFRYVRPYRRQGALSLVTTVLLALLALVEPWPLAFIVDTVLHGDSPPGWVTAVVGDGRRGLIVLGALFGFTVTLVAGLTRLADEYLSTNVDHRMVLDLRCELFDHVQRLSPEFHDHARTGTLVYRINDQAEAVGKVLMALPNLGQTILTLVGMALLALRIDPWLALLSMAVVPVVVGVTTYYANRIEPHLRRLRRLESATLTILHESLTMLRVIVTFGRESYEFDRFREKGSAAVDARVRLNVRQATFKLIINFVTALGSAVVLGVGALQVVNGRIRTGELLVILAYVSAVYVPLERLTNWFTQMQQQLMAFEASLSLLDTPALVIERPDAIALPTARGQVELDGVGFSYPSRRDTLVDISCRVDAGSSLAIVGPTGAGKSTLVSLLSRLHDVERGRVTIDGVDVRELTVESVRAQFSVVHQEPLLFTGTIRDNIAYAKPGASDAEIEQAARAANAHDFITRLPRSYDTLLGERGTKVSGGERQRISVARAFLRDAPILVLDEPTSSIDSRTEAVILEALQRLMRGRTTITIAHRLSTVKDADQILVLDEGRIADIGTHDELLDRGGLYHQLWTAQAQHRRRVDAARAAIAGTDLDPTHQRPHAGATREFV
jgi:ATP-binding cassette subfamily B protein